MRHPLAGAQIALVVVAGPFQAAHHVGPVGPLLNGLEQVQDIHLAGAGHPDDLDTLEG